MRAPAFWWRKQISPLALLLAPIGWLYGRITAFRMSIRPIEKGENRPTKIICIGNFTTGGAGKTPVAIAVAKRLQPFSHKVFFLSRGYGGSLPGPLRVELDQHDAALVGDEPLLLACVAPVIVARNRPAGAELGATLGADILILDDGLQNPTLKKDLSLVVVDGEVGIGNGFCLPAGPLRAPVASQWPSVDAVIILGEGAPGSAIRELANKRGLPVFSARLVTPETERLALSGKAVLAFTGIGRPEKFFQHLETLGIEVRERSAFGDHHRFSEREAETLLKMAQAQGLELVTTEKDKMRLQSLRLTRSGSALATLAERSLTISVDVQFANEEAFMKLLWP